MNLVAKPKAVPQTTKTRQATTKTLHDPQVAHPQEEEKRTVAPRVIHVAGAAGLIRALKRSRLSYAGALPLPNL